MLAYYGHLEFTHQEQRIVAYLNEKPHKVIELSAEALAKETYTSAATLNRFARKLGYKGFADFRLHYALDYQMLHEKKTSLQNGDYSNINSEDSLSFIHKSLSAEHSKVVSIQKEIYIEVMELINKSEYIDIYATGKNYHLAMIGADNLSFLGKKVAVFNNVEQDHLSRINHSHRICLLLSRTGENPTCLHAARELNAMSAKLISITGKQGSNLNELCALNLYINIDRGGKTQKVTDSISISWIFDYIFMDLLKRQSAK
ncbi:MurR/RpiR family transcriptional regulator [Scandinavium lactucae]|uniref:MurR/RpiR family transcriptional regulator n=1 Tax=Scandinavium lactucae TaxID=3095028 RepID=A0ABU4QQC7_9ENTR|nr:MULTISPECIES: MurR/RpiR family transcriptional regulator [unclassified Scandinavium]MDX6040692.1 MurR/RpiR family transcriptional regulator [Scandinavium sp. V105_6]MDX6051596.1 MurR/RpiR family transcriptional regulator [Scandinavium sp. V105_1]